MDLFKSNTLLIAGVGIILIVMMTYFFTYLRRKNNKIAKYLNDVYGLKDIWRSITGKIDLFAKQLKKKKPNKNTNTNNRLPEKSGNLVNRDSPPRYYDLPLSLKIDNPSRNNKNSGKSVRQNPKSPSYHTHLGNRNFERMKYGKAARRYKQALQIDRYFDPAYVGMGNIEYAQGKLFSAMRYYTFAIKMNINNHDALVGLGNCFQQIGKYEKALECYEKAYKLNTRNKDLNAELSNLYMARNEYNKVNDILTRSIALYPDCSRFYKRIGDMYSILNKEKKAIDAYIHFINLRCDKMALTNLVRSKFERYLALEIISDLIKGKRKINYDAFIKELTRMMTIFLIRQRILGEPNNTKHKAYQNFSNYFINKVLLCIVQEQGHQLHESSECNISAELQPYPNSI